MKHYILMGDILKSSDKNSLLLLKQFKASVAYINQRFSCDILSPLTITLGDEFQGIIKNKESAIKIILALEERIIHQNYIFQLRYVLHFGEIDTAINPHIAHQMLGEGLSVARTTLNNLKKAETRFYINTDNSPKDIIFNNAFAIFQQIISKWKPSKDHQLISELIKHKDYKIVAEHLEKDRSYIWKREKSLNMASYFNIKEIIITNAQL